MWVDFRTLFAKPNKFNGKFANIAKKFLQILTLYGRLFAIIGQAPAMTATIFNHQRQGFLAQQSLYEMILPELIGITKQNDFNF